MSLATPRALLIDIMVGQGFEEVPFAFDFENVGDSNLEKGFHVEQGTITNIQTNPQSNSVENDLVIRYWQKSGRTTKESEAMQKALEKVTEILNNVLDIKNRTDGVKNILLGEFTPVPISDDNDNIIRGEITLTVMQEICFSL